MKISLNWLKEYYQTDLSAQQISEALTGCGLEVESMETFESLPGGLRGVVIGQVMECAKHPNADKLSLTKVDVGGAVLFAVLRMLLQDRKWLLLLLERCCILWKENLSK
jgi:phenylalanyl-tRNA synthetase beta chain